MAGKSTARRKTIEPMEQKIGQDRPRIMKSVGPAKDALEDAVIEPVERPVNPEKLAMLAFMEELVEVHIHTTTDENAEQVFQVFNNGLSETFTRGETKTVKRKFVEGLARSKITTYRQKESIAPDGSKVYAQIPSTGLRYGFSVTRDDHPRGADWLKATLAQP